MVFFFVDLHIFSFRGRWLPSSVLGVCARGEAESPADSCSIAPQLIESFTTRVGGGEGEADGWCADEDTGAAADTDIDTNTVVDADADADEDAEVDAVASMKEGEVVGSDAC